MSPSVVTHGILTRLTISLITYCLLCLFCLLATSQVDAAEYSFKSDISARTEYDDNIFVTNTDHNSVTALTLIPSIDGVIKEAQWQADINAHIQSNNYSDHNLNSNDKFFDLTGKYNGERNIFSLNANYDLDSSLNTASSDFGLVGRRVKSRKKSFSPGYTRLLTERLALVLSYRYSDVDYLEAENTGFTPYIAQTASGSLIYNLTEKDKLTLSLQGVDYNSRNDLVTYTLLDSRFGIEHKFSETLSADFLAGVSRQKSTNLVTQSFGFFGNIIIQTREVNLTNRGLVLDAGVKQILESGEVDARISRNNSTNSFGGLNQVDTIKLNYNHRLSNLWRYRVNTRYEDVTAISTGTRSTDRQVLFFETVMSYALSRKWSVNGSYRYVKRKFTNVNNNGSVPHSNRIYLGMTYNFPTLSTF